MMASEVHEGVVRDKDTFCLGNDYSTGIMFNKETAVICSEILLPWYGFSLHATIRIFAQHLYKDILSSPSP